MSKESINTKQLEEQIAFREGINVTARHRNGRDVRDDRQVIPYPYKRAAPGDWTIKEFQVKRLRVHSPEIDFEIRTPSGTIPRGNTSLRKVRSA